MGLVLVGEYVLVRMLTSPALEGAADMVSEGADTGDSGAEDVGSLGDVGAGDAVEAGVGSLRPSVGDPDELSLTTLMSWTVRLSGPDVSKPS